MKWNRENYYKYLETPHWKQFCVDIQRERNGKCEGCGIENRTAFQKFGMRLNVHHKTYDNIGHEKPEDVELLCYRCHMNRHAASHVFLLNGFHGDLLPALAGLRSMPSAKSFSAHCFHCGVELSGVTLWNFDEQDREFFCTNCRLGVATDSDEERDERRAGVFLAVSQYVRTLSQSKVLRSIGVRNVA